MTKRITLLATGGTIACTPSANGLIPTLRAEDILRVISADLPCEVTGQDVFMMDSSNIQPEEWCALAEAAHDALRHCDGVVITHGTDTMAYTAAALSFMLAGIGKPVIVTGSQLPLGNPLTDARSNLLHAITAAMQGVGGVYVSFHDRLISGVRCVKTHTTSMDAFSSVNAPQAGRFDAEGVHFDHPQPYEGGGYQGRCANGRPALRPCDCRAVLDSRVFLLKMIPGTSPDVLRFVREAGYRGLVIEAFGLGGLHYIRRNLVKALSDLKESGILVLVVSQCLNEKANLSVYEVGREMVQEHVFSGFDMTTEAAVCKLMWALAQEDPAGVLRKSLVGEFSGSCQ